MPGTTVDTEGMSCVYEAIRDDTDPMNWAVFKFDGNNLAVASTGTEYDEFLSQFTDDDRAFAYVRVFVGDELSRRAKFVLVTWIGANVSVLKKAKMSTDKAFAKNVLRNIAVEIQTSELEELAESFVRNECIKAGGANYGDGSMKD